MDFVNQIVDSIVQSFDFGYCVAVNILTYIIIKIFDKRKEKRLSTWQKRVVLLVCIVVLSVIYYFIGADMRIVANSIILAPVSWSWIFKPMCKLFNIDYKKFNVLD